MLKIETLEKMMDNPDWRVRATAMKLSKGRNDVPFEVIEKGLCDSCWEVYLNAIAARDRWNKVISQNRTFEPPTRVYKNCIGNVIVVAHIPQDAYVRGHEGSKCRASKAEIVDIIGDLGGEKVGVSYYNQAVEYHIGDMVEIKDFDFSDCECASGFHFFCTLDEAKDYHKL